MCVDIKSTYMLTHTGSIYYQRKSKVCFISYFDFFFSLFLKCGNIPCIFIVLKDMSQEEIEKKERQLNREKKIPML